MLSAPYYVGAVRALGLVVVDAVGELVLVETVVQDDLADGALPFDVEGDGLWD